MIDAFRKPGRWPLRDNTMGLSMLILAPICAALVIGACFAMGKLFSRGERGSDD